VPQNPTADPLHIRVVETDDPGYGGRTRSLFLGPLGHVLDGMERDGQRQISKMIAERVVAEAAKMLLESPEVKAELARAAEAVPDMIQTAIGRALAAQIGERLFGLKKG